MKNEPARRRLARIRCLFDTINCIVRGKKLPPPLCFVASEVEFAVVDGSIETLPVYKKPSKNAEKIAEISSLTQTSVLASGDEYVNNEGAWLRLSQKSLQKFCAGRNVKEGWLMVVPYDSKRGVGTVRLVAVSEKLASSSKTKQQQMDHAVGTGIQSWQESVEAWYSLRLTEPPAVEASADKEAMKQLATPPPKWSLEADEQLARFLADRLNQQESNLGNVSQYVDSIEVSSEDDTKDALTDGDSETYWESDGSQSRHWIRLHMKAGTVIRQLSIGVDAGDDNYFPNRVIVCGGHIGNMKQLSDTSIDMNKTGDVVILKEMSQFYPVIEIKIKECKDDGIDTRIHGIKLLSVKEKEPGLSKDIFASADLIRFPKLDSVDQMLLYRRSQALLRFTELLDSVLHFLLPSWNYTAGSFKDLEAIRQLLPLSKHRNALIDKLLRESQTCSPPRMPKLYINRRLAAEHTADPSQDPDAKRSVFHQLYEGLREEKCGLKLDFRWSTRYDQWWECKFLSEGIIDQGGGFRDSLADMAEELCPGSSDSAMPLPFFVRSPNQLHDTSNVNRDAYVPNRACQKFGKFEWIGLVMAGCLRSGREHLVLAFPSFVWKQLVGERVTWFRDFKSVDLAQVKLLESLEWMDEETYNIKFGGVLTYTTVLTDGSLAELVPGGADRMVDYEDRLRYAELVKDARMNDGKLQIDAMRRGLLKVLPQAVLDLLTWQELEKRVCGDPELSVEALKKCTHYEDINENDKRVKFLWRALENFSNEDRSRFLRFVSGRRRLPAPLYLCPGRSAARDDSLPEAATCSSTLFLPEYSSAKVAEEKLRYAAYNCVAIDTDLSPWEE